MKGLLFSTKKVNLIWGNSYALLTRHKKYTVHIVTAEGERDTISSAQKLSGALCSLSAERLNYTNLLWHDIGISKRMHTPSKINAAP